MTLYMPRRVVCVMCQHAARRSVLASASLRGSPDLDTRPDGVGRHLYSAHIQRCAECGYCAVDLSKPALAAVVDVFRSPAYQQASAQTGVPTLARDFVCLGMLEVARGRRTAQAWCHVKAAWACDDASRPDLASGFRLRASAELLKGEEPVTPATHLVRVDLLRRAGAFQEAMLLAQRLIDAHKPASIEDLFADLLSFEIDLARRRDTAAHSVRSAELESPHYHARLALKRQREADRRSGLTLAKEAALAQVTPKLFLLALRDFTNELAKTDGLAASWNWSSWKETTDALHALLRKLPLPDHLKQVMVANIWAYRWPPGAAIAALGTAVWALVPDAAVEAAFARRWQDLCTSHALHEYLSYCLRETTPTHWHYVPPLAGDALQPPKYS